MSSIESLKIAGSKDFAENRISEAVQKFTEAIKAVEAETKEQLKTNKDFIHPQAAALYSNRSACYAKEKRFHDALGDAEKCIIAKPDWWKGHCRKAYAFEGLQRYEDCEQSLKDCLQYDPENEEMSSKLRYISNLVAKKTRGKDKEASATLAKNKGGKMLPPAIHGKWLDIANKNQTQALPTPNCRVGQKLTVRPSVLSVAPSEPSRPMFFPAAPKWPLDPVGFANNFVDHITDTTGRTPPRQETQYLLQLSSNAYLNQKKADDAYRKQNNIKPECAYCGVDLCFEDPSHCECGEPFCSRQCLELGWKDHKKICDTIRSQSESLPMFHRIYWDGCRFGAIDWIGQRVKNYSNQYYALKKAKGGDTSVAAAGPAANNKAKRDVNAKLNENDVEDVDEFTYLMMHERTAMMNECTKLQEAVRLAASSGDQKATNVASEDICAALLEFYLQMSYYDDRSDTPYRCQFKLTMAEVLMGVLKQFNLVSYVESLDMVMMRFTQIFQNAGDNEFAKAQEIVRTAQRKMKA